MTDPDPYQPANRVRWNELAPIHYRSAFYDVARFKAGHSRLDRTEREELGDVAGKSLLHLQCHFGLDTLSWARLGATVTGVDYAETAIALAQSLSAETGVPATFICADVYELPDVLSGRFDIVYTSYGVLSWLPDLPRWAAVIAHFLTPGGTFYIVEAHPFAWVFDDAATATELQVRYPYFPSGAPLTAEVQGSYADPTAQVTHTVEHCWPHPLSDILTALLGAGLQIEFLHEFPHAAWQMFPFMEANAAGVWQLTGPRPAIPLTFSLKATKAGVDQRGHPVA